MLTRLIDTWLATRRANGFALRQYERHLHRFAEFATARGEDHIRTATAVAWAGQAGTPGQRRRHFQRIVQLARYLHAEDGRHEIPPAGHFPASRHRPSALARNAPPLLARSGPLVRSSGERAARMTG